MNEKVVGRRETGSQQVTVSRRTLMKMLAAAGVVVGVERMLPVKWITPSAKASPGVAPPVYPGTCNEDDFPLTILSSQAELVDPNTSQYRVSFEYNEIGDYLTEYAFLFANIVDGQLIYDRVHLSSGANGSVTPLNVEVLSLACAVVPNGDDGPGNPAGFVGTVNGSGEFYFNLPEDGFATDAAAAEAVVLNWSLMEPENRSSPPELTTAVPAAVTLSDFVIKDPGDGVKTAAATAAAAGLGVVSLKALRRDTAGEAPGETE